MGRKSLKETRRNEIVSTFYEVAKVNGLENTSIAKIADQLDINPSLVLHYFKTREELLAGLIDFILEKYSRMFELQENRVSTPTKLKKLIGTFFSRKWNELFDDGVFYSCYSLIYRDASICRSFKKLHDMLRKWLVDILVQAKKNNIIEVENESETAELIFALIEGAYYYLGMVEDKKEYNAKLKLYHRQALEILKLPVEENIA